MTTNNNKQIEEGFGDVKQNQIDAEECQQIRHEVSEKNANNREQANINIDSNRETRWMKRWIAAFAAAIVAVIGATWYTTSYVTHWYGNRVYPEAPPTAALMDELAAHKKLTASVIAEFERLKSTTKTKTRTKLWFDRRRQHNDLKFAIVDNKFPAGYEIWEDGELIERWHWKIEGQPKTDQYGDYIFRCVSTYNKEGEYSGFKQYVMANYPDDEGFIMPIDNALEFTLNIKKNFFKLKSYDLDMNGMEIMWKDGKVVHTYLHERDFMHSKQEGTDRDLYSIIQEPEQLTYMEHLSKMFPFIQTDVLEPFKKSIRYEKIKAAQSVLKKRKAAKTGRVKG